MSNKSYILAGVATVAAVGIAAHYLVSKKEAAGGNKGPSVRKSADKAAVGKDVCQFVANAAKSAIKSRGVFHLAVAGGSLLDTLSKLVDHKDDVDFSKVVLSFANHKCVAPTSDKATLTKCKSKFADAVGITRFIEPSPTPADSGDGSAEAEFYAKALKDAGVPHVDGKPLVDLILLGLGADGHVGSCHPLGPAVAEASKSVAASPKSGEPASITFTIETMNAARQVGVVVTGGAKGKKEAVKRAMTRPAETPRGTFPAQSLEAPIFFVDSEAAADL